MAITHVGAASANSNTVSLPAGTEDGDIAIVTAGRSSTTPASIPTGWVDEGSAQGGSGGSAHTSRHGWKILTFADVLSGTVGTWTNANQIAVTVYRGASRYERNSVAAVAATSTTITLPAQSGLESGAWQIGMVAHRGSGANTVKTRSMTNYTNRSSGLTSDNMGVWDSNAATSGIAQQTATVSTSDGNEGWTGELRASPLPVGGAAYHYDFSDTSLISHTGGSVDSVATKSGYDGTLTSTGTNRPITGTRTLNGMNALDFDGSNDAVFLNITDIPQPVTVVAVFRSDDATNADNVTPVGSDTWITAIGGTWGGAAAGAFDWVQPGTPADDQTHVFGYIAGSDGTNVGSGRAYALDETGASDANTSGHGTGSLVDLTVGSRSAFGNAFDGVIGEVIYYPYPLSAAELATVVDYLNDKWIPQDQTVTLTGPTVTVTPGTLTVRRSIMLVGPTITVTPGTLTVEGQAVSGVINLAGPTITVTPGVLQVNESVALVGPTITVTPGALTVEQSIVLLGPTVSITPGALLLTVEGQVANVVVRPSGDELLDLAARPRRKESMRWELLDAQNAVLGPLEVIHESASITNDVNRTIRRQGSGFALDPDAAAGVDFIANRVRPWWVLDGGGPGYEWPLGVFLFADASRLISTRGTRVEVTLHDQSLILSQPLSSPVGFGPNTSIFWALALTAEWNGFHEPRIDSTTATTAGPMAWVPGRDSLQKVMEDLCLMAGFVGPYFDAEGHLVCRQAPSLTDGDADFSYGIGTRVVADSIVESNDLLNAPNRYIALDTGPNDTPIFGQYDVPDEAPHSYANRGYRIVKQVEQQGLGSQFQAELAAYCAAVLDAQSYGWLSFDSTPDPRHDTFNTVDFDGVRYREVGWTLECEPGGTMNHDLRKAAWEAVG